MVTARIVIACLMLAACSGGERRIGHDLARELAIAEVLQETPVIDVGSAPARRWLAAGWYPDERGDGGVDFAWSEGDESVLELVVLEPTTIEASLRCRPYAAGSSPPRIVHIEINGHALTSFELDDGFKTYPLTLPVDCLRVGRNRLVFRYPQPRSPREVGLGDDWRRLALAVDWLRLAPGEQPPPPLVSDGGVGVEVPLGTSLGYSLTFADGLRLELDGMTAINGGSCRLRCVVVRDGRRDVTVAELEPGERAARVDLTGPPGEAFRLELQVVGEALDKRNGAKLRLMRPRVTEPSVSVVAASERATPEVKSRPNVVVYLVDALRADRVGVYGQPRPLTPRVDAFAAGATVYDRAWAQSSWTRPAVASLFTGLRPEVHCVNGRLDRLGEGVETLAQRLAGAGYATAAVVANPNASGTFGLDRGFGDFVLMPADRRRSSDVHAELVRWLDGHDPERPFLLYVHTVDPHLPYDPPARFRDRFAPGVERRDLGSTEVVGSLLARDLVDEGRWTADLLALYDAEVASNDEAFGALLDELDRRGLGDATAVVFLSDHGEEFFDHGGWIHGRTLYREVLQVPLVIRLPGQREGRREAAPVSHVDLMPTLLELAGVDSGSGLHGRSLLGPLDAPRTVAAFLDLDGWGGWSVVRDGHHAIRHQRLGYVGPAELYELDADPEELRDLGRDFEVTAGALLDESRRETLDEAGRIHSAPAAIDDELRRRLEALGYL